MNRPRPGEKARPGVEQENRIVARVAGRVKEGNMRIYVVTGSWYGADEHEEWLICAYMDEDKANEHAANAQRRNDEIQNEPHPWDCPRCPKGIVTVGFFGYPIKTRCDNSKGFVCPNQKPTNEYDPNHRDNYDNEYSVEEVELVES